MSQWLTIAVLIVVWVVAFGLSAAVIADRRRRSVPAWIVLGSILGPIAFVILQLAPPGRCPSCGARTEGWVYMCPSCGQDTGRARDRPPTAEPRAEPDSPETMEIIPETSIPAAEGPRGDHVQDTAAAQRPTRAQDRRSAGGGEDHAAPPTTRVLATGIFIGGSRPLDIGGRYIIVVDGDDLEVRGPVDIGPDELIGRWALSSIDASGLTDRLAISSRGGSTPAFALMFRGLSGASPEVIEQAVERAQTSSPVKGGADV